jgi:excisionase family DNA binding protein
MKEKSEIDTGAVWERRDLEQIIKNYGTYLEPGKFQDYFVSPLGKVGSPDQLRRLKYYFDRALDSLGAGKWTWICGSRSLLMKNFKHLTDEQKVVVALYFGYGDDHLQNMDISDVIATRNRAFSKMIDYLNYQQFKDSHVLLNIKQVAERLDISEAGVRKLIGDGRIKTGKVGGQNLIREEDVVSVQNQGDFT